MLFNQLGIANINYKSFNFVVNILQKSSYCLLTFCRIIIARNYHFRCLKMMVKILTNFFKCPHAKYLLIDLICGRNEESTFVFVEFHLIN
jgi:hypothetical protein